MTYEIYYNDGGHGGPYQDFEAAYRAAKSRLLGSTTTIEMRPRNSKAIGGFGRHNKGSFYLYSTGATERKDYWSIFYCAN